VEGAQGALVQPEWIRGCELTLESPPCYVGVINHVERLIRPSRCRKAERDNLIRVASPVTEKVPERSGVTDASKDNCASSSMPLVWGPGAGVEAAGRLCLGQNKTGVASIPKLVATLRWR